MSDIDHIAAARALIEPLTGYTPEPWSVSECEWTGYVYGPAQRYDEGFDLADARLIAAAPDLRDMVATLADALEASRLALRNIDAARRESFDAGFDAGFAASGEGYNFEYPFQDHGIKPREDLEWSTHASNARAVWMARFAVQEVSE